MTRISLFRLSLRNRFSRALVLYLGFILEDLRFKKLLAALAGQKVCVLVKSWRWVCCAAGVESPPPPPPASDSLSQTPSPRTHHGERKTPIKTRRFSVSSIWHKIYFFCLLRLLTNHAVQKNFFSRGLWGGARVLRPPPHPHLRRHHPRHPPLLPLLRGPGLRSSCANFLRCFVYQLWFDICA